MKKAICLLISAVLILTLYGCGNAKETVYLLTEVEGEAFGDFVGMGDGEKEVFSYNANGYLTKIQGFYNGKCTYEGKLSYDENNYLMHWREENFDSETGSLFAEREFDIETDQAGRVTRMDGTENGLGSWEYIFIYDGGGNRLERVYLENGEFVLRETMTYSTEGQLLTYKDSRSDGYIINRECQYDSDGRLVQKKFSNEWEGNTYPSEYAKISYNADGKMSHADYFDSAMNPTGFMIRFDYDEAGNLIREESYENGVLTFRYSYTYQALTVPSDSIEELNIQHENAGIPTTKMFQ